MIFYDPSEARVGSRLPDNVIKAGRALPDLEQMTGADLLITPISKPTLSSVNLSSVPTRLAFEKHCKAGLLVQRKSGRDLVSSIPKLSETLAKMLEWTLRPWLLFTGQILCDHKGQAIVDGQGTGFTHNAVQGALTAWQLRGGYISILSRDELMLPWLNLWLDRLQNWQSEKLVSRPIQQQMIGLKYPWAQTLATFPGVGLSLASELAEYSGSLKDALFALSSPDFDKLPGRPKGFGKRTVQSCRDWMGLEEGEIIVPMKGEQE